jgi:hypothetical protein
VRFKLRLAMVGLAIVAIATWAVEMKRREEVYRLRAVAHANHMVTDENRLCLVEGNGHQFCRLGDPPSQASEFSLSLSEEFAECLRWRSKKPLPTPLTGAGPAAIAREQYHHRMYHKWLRAASRPWLYVEPDDPPR